jgi:hypothetical protein
MHRHRASPPGGAYVARKEQAPDLNIGCSRVDLRGKCYVHRFDVVNFFGYFTNLSNIFAAVVFLIGAAFLIQQREPTQTQEIVRGASVVHFHVPVAGFYPYPFLDPANGGYGMVALYCIGIFVAFLIVGGVIATAGNRLPRNVA